MDYNNEIDIEEIKYDKKDKDSNDSKDSKDISLVKELFESYEIKSKEDINKYKTKLAKKYKTIPSITKILSIYKNLVSNGELSHDKHIQNLLVKKATRSHSGVVVITSFFSPYPSTKDGGVQKFSCEYNCAYCPSNPGMPRSYDENEPGVRRAIECKFDSKEQFWNRARTLQNMGHPLDKIEVIFLGGTFSSFPREYITEFFRDHFYAANVMNSNKIREPLSLEQEQYINQHESSVKIIGITIETRPDRIDFDELVYLRKLGVTRVQLGVQHTDDRILKHINRRCYTKDTVNAIRLLKSCCFKVDIHIMPDLPHPLDISMQDMIELDKKMFEKLFENPYLQADQWKIYPCATIPYTKIKRDYESGNYKPYGELRNPDVLFELLIDVKSKVKPWVRLNRVVRDIPKQIIIGGYENVSMRNDLLIEMKKRGLKCRCVRCREIKTKQVNISDFEIKTREYKASNGIEYFISWEDKDENLLGFLRLRIDGNSNNYNKIRNNFFPELEGCSLIRELHVYGQITYHNKENDGFGVQHKGLGKSLIAKAEEISKNNGLYKMAVIAGVGVKNYYIKRGFEENGYYLVKKIKDDYYESDYFLYLIGNVDREKYIEYTNYIIIFFMLTWFITCIYYIDAYAFVVFAITLLFL